MGAWWQASAASAAKERQPSRVSQQTGADANDKLQRLGQTGWGGLEQRGRRSGRQLEQRRRRRSRTRRERWQRGSVEGAPAVVGPASVGRRALGGSLIARRICLFFVSKESAWRRKQEGTRPPLVTMVNCIKSPPTAVPLCLWQAPASAQKTNTRQGSPPWVWHFYPLRLWQNDFGSFAKTFEIVLPQGGGV